MTSNTAALPLKQVNSFLLQKQHLAPGTRLNDPLQVVADICALHATSALTPYLSLWSRVERFQASQLETELYERRELVRVLCMRSTLHIVPTSRLAVFFQSTRQRLEHRVVREAGQLLVGAGLCQEGKELETLRGLQLQVLEALASRGAATFSELSEWVPGLKAQVKYGPGRAYEGQFSIGSRLIPAMAVQGLLVRARPRGTWRSNLHEYSLLRDWLPFVNLDDSDPEQARVQIVRWYLAAFGPARTSDIAWWTGFSSGEIGRALMALASELVEVGIQSLEGTFWTLSSDLDPLRDATPLAEPCVTLLPSLDPYVMGYNDRRRFLSAEHYDQVFDRSGNALPTVWLQGRVVGVWRELDRAMEILTWADTDCNTFQTAALPLARFLRQADRPGSPSEGDVEVIVRPYPQELYARTPFTLGRRE